MAEEIVRSLADGPDYAPDWRARIVSNHLVEVVAAQSADARLAEILVTEKDPFIRQFLRFRYNERSANAAAFQYAVGCQNRNAATGGVSLIRAMLVADRTPAEIAAELGTQTQNIVTFAKVFFDVRRYLDNEGWLRRIVFGETADSMSEAESLRERRWLAAAFHRGWEGVQQVVFHRTPSKAVDVEALALKLQGTLASRALEFAMGLETSGTAATEADLDRLLAARNTQAKQLQPVEDNTATATAFIRGLHGLLEQKAEALPDDPELAIFRGGPKRQDVTETPRRMRTRFASQ